MKAIIIDDERKARSLLSTLVKEYCTEITFLAEAEDLLSGIKKIRENDIDLVFLDIEMPEHSGLEIFDLYKGEINFNIVFTTAYNEYALKAFEMNAIDYLLKPIRPSLLKEAVKKVSRKLESQNIVNQISELRTCLKTTKFSKIGLPVSDGILFVKLENIIMLEADGMYTKVNTNDNKTILVSKPLKYFVELLNNTYCFYRPHRSHLINLDFVKQYIRKDGNYIIMENGTSVTVSREKKDEFFEIISKL